ncbi:MAG: hypothetical protein Q8T09_20265 [Candidatus Melainabacteria bacterium]|nr:hypothetical protein [Candidatus Melainabacteria bacterium]
MKLLKLITASLFSITVLCSCDFEERLTWSPDGQRMAILADQLRLADSDSISRPLLNKQFGSLLSFRWLPDNHHALLAYRRFQHRRNSAGAKMPDISVDYVQLFDFNGDISVVKATAGPVLYKSNEAIDDMRLSPNGKMAAISQVDKGRRKISILTLSGGLKVVARNASRPEWSRDSRSIYFFREISPKDSAHATFMPVSTICSLPVADAEGLSVVSKLRYDLVQCAGDVFSGGRIHALADGSLLFSSTPVKLPACGVMLGAQERALFRYRPASRGCKAAVEQIILEGPVLASDLDSIEPNQDGTKLAICSTKGGVWVISLSNEDRGRVTVLEKPLPDSAEIGRTGSFGCAPRWRNAHQLSFSVRSFDNAKNFTDNTAYRHGGEVVLQDLQDLGSGKELPPRQVLSRSWPVGKIDFLKVGPSTK